MDLGLTPEQQTVQQEARRFLAAEITRERRLEWDRSPTGYDPAFWRAVSELGWLGYGLPAAHGGQGASLLDVGLLVEEWGRAAAPFGLFAALSGGLALAALGTPAQRRAWLPAVARGEKIVTLAVSEAEVEAEPAAGVRVTPVETFAKDREATVRFAGVVLPASAVCGRAGAAWPRLEQLRRQLA